MNKLNILAVLVVLSEIASAQNHGSCWMLWVRSVSDVAVHGEHHSQPSIFHTSHSFADAELQQDPARVLGSGEAHDELVPYEAHAAAAATGFIYEAWCHVGPGVGEVELVKGVLAEGDVELIHPDARAKAVGWSRAYHWFDNNLDALGTSATMSAAATSTNVAGNLNVSMVMGAFSSGLGSLAAQIKIPLQVQFGIGRYPDDGGNLQLRVARHCPVGIFEHDDRAHSNLSVWANAGFITVASFGSAGCRAGYLGLSFNHYCLLCHAQCPGPSGGH